VLTVLTASACNSVSARQPAAADTPQPSRTPAAVPPHDARNCIRSPHICGYPDTTNTGVPQGVALKASGSVVVKRDGTVIDARSVDGTIDVYANDVTISRTIVRSGSYFPIRQHPGFHGLRVVDTEIAGAAGCQSAIASDHYTALRVNAHGCEDGLEADGDVTVRDSLIHGLRVTATSHNDGVQMLSGSRVVIEHNTITQPLPSTSAVNLTSDAGPISEVSVRDNLLDGGAYTVYSRRGGSRFPAPTQITFAANRFSRSHLYGPLSTDGAVAWTGNVWDDTGTPMR
jgi:hypothetical protein